MMTGRCIAMFILMGFLALDDYRVVLNRFRIQDNYTLLVCEGDFIIYSIFQRFFRDGTLARCLLRPG